MPTISARRLVTPLLFSSLLLVGCEKHEAPLEEGKELTYSECKRLVQHAQRIESADTGGLLDTLHAGRRSDIQGCLKNATSRAYQCVLQAQTVKDLRDCDQFFE